MGIKSIDSLGRLGSINALSFVEMTRVAEIQFGKALLRARLHVCRGGRVDNTRVVRRDVRTIHQTQQVFVIFLNNGIVCYGIHTHILEEIRWLLQRSFRMGSSELFVRA